MNVYYLKLDGESRRCAARWKRASAPIFPQIAAIVDPIEQTKRQLIGSEVARGHAVGE